MLQVGHQNHGWPLRTDLVNYKSILLLLQKLRDDKEDCKFEVTPYEGRGVNKKGIQ